MYLCLRTVQLLLRGGRRGSDELSLGNGGSLRCGDHFKSGFFCLSWWDGPAYRNIYSPASGSVRRRLRHRGSKSGHIPELPPDGFGA